MYASRIDIPDHARKAAIQVLQARLSDALDLDAQLKQAHWNVRGMGFFGLHQLFDKVHGEVEGFADSLAERIAALGGVADGRVQTTAAQTQLYEYALETRAGSDHLRAIAAVVSQFGKALRADIDVAAAIPDAVTADVLTEVARATDSQLWFVEAHLDGR
ncbi:MAG: DNA starvation/stationary phase protection protein Dps [Alphaproteobacteria bacterium]|nr:DNA starvation/stationary phase protection protein Dps [Alphaproteobacteria bacterium]MBU1515148.1 DNA starvation/stationary phase protection protein Dps [Alphaproteobacteria bacterium]MBU2092278.1 DNA starvation/stationary phase protection protein Dps [Alphaproteobacteria bacterium]MBU2152872.1 DNA starvation/stationary phase protection protein Dps [Alphaproteobacteria bacterium]MBU2305703.1 DNA starvation/stationary phase protection protein Dps [Alphaproteobacteria bacterium]